MISLFHPISPCSLMPSSQILRVEVAQSIISDISVVMPSTKHILLWVGGFPIQCLISLEEACEVRDKVIASYECFAKFYHIRTMDLVVVMHVVDHIGAKVRAWPHDLIR